MSMNDSFFHRKFGILRGDATSSSVGSAINTGESSDTADKAKAESDIVASVIEYASTLKGEYEEKHKQLKDDLSATKHSLNQEITKVQTEVEAAKHSHIKWLVCVAAICLGSIAAGAWTMYANLDEKYNQTRAEYHSETKAISEDVSSIKTTIGDIDKHDKRLTKIESDVATIKMHQAVTQSKFNSMNENLSKSVKAQ
ncbi:hypothetical protein HYO11_19140 [Vibrio parahaemolyticus]|nr:hypothetical protein [Vibrio parahaemolyticus]MBM5031645.1 hypothetical protein [Vibrio parahaemolyticus]